MVLGIIGWGALNTPAVKKLRSYPTPILQQEANAMQMKLDAASIAGIKENPREKSELQKEKFNYELEIARRFYAVDWLSITVAVFGLGLFGASFLSKPQKASKKTKVRVIEIMPSEVYVDEAEYYRRSHDAFPSKDAALAWYDNDPLRTCTYCGANAVKPVKGTADEIQLTTFYKKVPSTAKDLRIVLGSLWFVRPAAELQCENCDQRVLR